jgi:hypothetical protein
MGEEETMIAGFLLGLVADIVFGSAASLRRSFSTEMDRYLDRRAFAAPTKRQLTPIR